MFAFMKYLFESVIFAFMNCSSTHYLSIGYEEWKSHSLELETLSIKGFIGVQCLFCVPSVPFVCIYMYRVICVYLISVVGTILTGFFAFAKDNKHNKLCIMIIDHQCNTLTQASSIFRLQHLYQIACYIKSFLQYRH